MLETEDRAVAPGHSLDDGFFGRLTPGESILIQPSIPRPAEHLEYRVQCVEAGRIVLRQRASDPLLSIATAAIAELQSARGPKPAKLILKGRLQWITAAREWTVLPEEPPAESEHGLHKLTSASEPRVVEFIEDLRQRGYSAWWVPVDRVREFLGEGGEVIYDSDGRYLRTRDQRSEWILLAKNPAAAAASLP